jgi:hypothetical protein
MPTSLVSRTTPPVRERLKNVRAALAGFFFARCPDTWLTVLRVGLGLQLIIYCVSLGGDWTRLLSTNGAGLINRALAEDLLALDAPIIPKLGWLVECGNDFGLAEETVLTAVWIILLLASCCLVLGLFCRASAIVACFVFLAASKSGDFFAYGVDNFMRIGLFYLMLSPLPDSRALDRKLWPRPAQDRHVSGFFLRVLQLHLCVAYFFSGLTKSLGAPWWNGESMWRALTRPPFNIIPTDVVLFCGALLPAIGIAVWVLELGYSVFIWPRQTRAIWLGAILLMHIGIGLAMGLYLFASIMIVLNLAAFGSGFILDRHKVPAAA